MNEAEVKWSSEWFEREELKGRVLGRLVRALLPLRKDCMMAGCSPATLPTVRCSAVAHSFLLFMGYDRLLGHSLTSDAELPAFAFVLDDV